MSSLRQRIKKRVFGLLGKDPEAVVVSFRTGPEPAAGAMLEEIRKLVPDRRHLVVGLGEAGAEGVLALRPAGVWGLYRQLRRQLRGWRVGLAPVLFTADGRYRALRWAAFLLAPTKILAYNARLERHHLRLSQPLASWLFLRGVPLDRIHLRPGWLWPWKKDRSRPARFQRMIAGRPPGDRRRVGVLTPYFPYPLSHGGAVRIYHLLREMAREFDLYLFAFGEDQREEDLAPILEFCAEVVLFSKPRYREPRWSTLLPPEVCEYRSEEVRQTLELSSREYGFELLLVEYTALASYPGDVLVEHDVTFDLARQVYERERTLSAWWDWWRWHRFERRAVARFRRVAAMSAKDAGLLARPHVRVIENGVDLDRFNPLPERAGRRLLFVGSFRHFPNLVACRFFLDEVWPRLEDVSLTLVSGPEGRRYWREQAARVEPPAGPGIRLLEFVSDVRPLYDDANLVIVPTLVSAGTNLKVLEAMAMRRAVVSTSCGCAGLGLQHGESVWIADSAADFAAAIHKLLGDEPLRARLAQAARERAEGYDWKTIGRRQREMLRELLGVGFHLRPGLEEDLEAISRIQAASPQAARWQVHRYLDYDLLVGDRHGRVAGFLVSRRTAPGETEILNLAVDPEFRRQGLGAQLVQAAVAGAGGEVFLEVRESNTPARRLYTRLGFQEAGVRKGYYDHPPEAAIVMRLQSC